MTSVKWGERPAPVEERVERHPQEETVNQDPHLNPRPQRIPAMQQILDNPFLLLFIGITIPTVLYIVWGVMEIASIPVAPQ